MVDGMTLLTKDKYMRVSNHSRWTLIATLLLGFFGFFLGSQAFAMDEDNGKLLPSFSIPTLSGKRLTNKTFQGHASLLNVWASWCHYCRNEHNMLLKIKNTYHVPIYGLNFKDNPTNARAWLQEEGNPYIMVGVDENGAVGENLGVTGTPVTFVLDKHGRIRYQYTGGIDESSWNGTLYPMIQRFEKES